MWHSAPCRRCNTWCRGRSRWPPSGWGHGPSSSSWSRSLDHHSSGSSDSLIITLIITEWVTRVSSLISCLGLTPHSGKITGIMRNLLGQRRGDVTQSTSGFVARVLSPHCSIVCYPLLLFQSLISFSVSIIHLLFWASQGRVNLTNSLKFPIKDQSGPVWPDLTPLSASLLFDRKCYCQAQAPNP